MNQMSDLPSDLPNNTQLHDLHMQMSSQVQISLIQFTIPQQIPEQYTQLAMFWQSQQRDIELIDPYNYDFKSNKLPLARIKKIMKSDQDVKVFIYLYQMISAEVPILFAKACDLFISELTMRSWNNTEENKRRTLQKNDIALAVNKADVYDFLIDIIPREDVKNSKKEEYSSSGYRPSSENVQYYYNNEGMPPNPNNYDPNVLFYRQQQLMQHRMMLGSSTSIQQPWNTSDPSQIVDNPISSMDSSNNNYLPNRQLFSFNYNNISFLLCFFLNQILM